VELRMDGWIASGWGSKFRKRGRRWEERVGVTFRFVLLTF
jgi:hypothetical protein